MAPGSQRAPDRTSPIRKASLRADDTFESINELGSLELMSKDLGLAPYGPLKKSISADSLSSISSIGNNFGQDFTVGQVEVSMEYDGKAATLHVTLLQGKDLLEKEDARFESCFMRISLLPAEQIVGISRVSRPPPPPLHQPPPYVRGVARHVPAAAFAFWPQHPLAKLPKAAMDGALAAGRSGHVGVRLVQDFWSLARGGWVGGVSILRCRGVQMGLCTRDLAGAEISPSCLGCAVTLLSLSVACGEFSCLTFPAPGAGDAAEGGGNGLGWDLGRGGAVGMAAVPCRVPRTLDSPSRSRAPSPAAATPSLPAGLHRPGQNQGWSGGVKPPFLSAPKAALRKQEPQFLSAVAFGKAQAQPLWFNGAIPEGAEGCVPLKKPFQGGGGTVPASTNPLP